jgi:PiT family inorganic phosphate transporter
MDPILIVGLVVALALFFDFTNGFHDTANSSATAIATGALKPRTAVIIAALMNLVGAFLSTAVAKTISVSLINEGVNLGAEMVFAGLTGAILWNLTTWLLGLPSSSSHALFGGLIGAALAYAGVAAINFPKVLEKVIFPALFAPLVAGIAALLATRLAYLITARSQAQRKKTGIGTGRNSFKVGQIFSSSLVALSHGTNDAQKTMGVITLVLVTSGIQADGNHVEWWVIIAAAAAIALGTYSGGWRIIKTMGSGLAEIKPPQGLSAEVATGVTILASSNLGFALSTTQVASGSVMGAGLGRKGGAVRWNKAGQVFAGWFFTLPAAGAVGALSAFLTMSGPYGLLIDAVFTIGAILAIFQMSRRNRIGHHNVLSEVEGASEVIASPRQVRAAQAKAARAAKAAKKGKK